MRRLAALALLAATAGIAGGLAHDAGAARTFVIVTDPEASGFPSADVPNGPGDIRMPAAIMVPPAAPQDLTFQGLAEIWRKAGAAYGVPWQVLASINKIESDFGRNMGPSSAGAVGWMQFLPSTWERWGVDADGDGIADPWNATDAVYSAARYLAATGAPEDIRRAVFAYNHSDEYVADVLSLARVFDPANLPVGDIDGRERTFSIDPLQRRIDTAARRVERREQRLERMRDRIERLEWSSERLERRAGDPDLSDAAFRRLDRQQRRLSIERRLALDAVGRATDDLTEARAALERLQLEAQSIPAEQGRSVLSRDYAGILPTPPTPAAGRVIDWALQQLGTPYLWGGHHGYSLEEMIIQQPSLWNGGFDCSSLLSWAFAKGAGFYIGDWTGSQWEYGASAPGASRGAGPAQGGSEPSGGYRPGDLVFFNNLGHVGLYIGNDLFVHAPQTGDVVKISQLSTYTPVWGWVRYEQVSGVSSDGAPANGGATTFRIVATDVVEAAPAPPSDGPVFRVLGSS